MMGRSTAKANFDLPRGYYAPAQRRRAPSDAHGVAAPTFRGISMNTLPTSLDVASAKLPAAYEQARIALASCENIDECQTWADKAAALASYAKMADDDTLMKMATRIRDRAIRRAGELLKQIEPGQGARDGKRADGGDVPLTRTQVARSAGLSERQQTTAVRLASIPLDDFEAQVESDHPPTVTQLAQQGVQRRVSRPAIGLRDGDPGEFNRSHHFVAEIEDYANAIAMADLDEILPALTASQAATVRKLIGEIDLIHTQIVTRRLSQGG